MLFLFIPPYVIIIIINVYSPKKATVFNYEIFTILIFFKSTVLQGSNICIIYA